MKAKEILHGLRCVGLVLLGVLLGWVLAFESKIVPNYHSYKAIKKYIENLSLSADGNLYAEMLLNEMLPLLPSDVHLQKFQMTGISICKSTRTISSSLKFWTRELPTPEKQAEIISLLSPRLSELSSKKGVSLEIESVQWSNFDNVFEVNYKVKYNELVYSDTGRAPGNGFFEDLLIWTKVVPDH